MLDDLLVLFLALAALVWGARVVIINSVHLARWLRLSDAAIGFLLVSVATSLPELAVSIQSGLRGETGLIVGNVLGSNIANVCLAVGVTALITTMFVREQEFKDLSKALLIASVLPFLLLLDLGAFTGVFLLFAFILYAGLVLRESVNVVKGEHKGSIMDLAKAGTFFLIGVGIILLSSEYAVSSAVDLARIWGVPNVFIGGVLLAVGTSLPEIVVSLTAIKSGNIGLSLGNIVGSSIVNLTLVLGSAALFNPLRANLPVFLNLVLFSIVANALLWSFIRRGSIRREQGAVLIGFYALFIATTLSVI